MKAAPGAVNPRRRSSRRFGRACLLLTFAVATAIVVIPTVARAASAEDANITFTCGFRQDGVAVATLTETVVNLPPSTDVSLKVTMSASGHTTTSTTSYDSARYGSVLSVDQNPPIDQATPYVISMSWTDGVGGGGRYGPLHITVPGCTRGVPFPATHAVVGMANASDQSLWLATSDGWAVPVGNFPGSAFYGITPALVTTNAPLVGSASSQTAPSNGVYLAASDGGIFTLDGATFLGSAQNLHLSKPIVGIASTPDGRGYWLVAADGGVFSYGDAQFFGSAGNLKLSQPVVGIAPTSDGMGYWLVASDGGVFAYGDAHFHGSMGGQPLAKPMKGISADPATGGYWLVASDGGVFSFGAPFFGSAANIQLSKPVVGMSSTSTGLGYRLVAGDGGIFDYGDAPFVGSIAH